MCVKKTILIIVSILAFTSLSIQAEQFLETEHHEIHYNAFNSSMLSPETASQYNIQRSQSLGVINIAVLDKTDKAVTAFIEGHTKNSLAQLNELNFTKVTEGNAIYYIATYDFIDKGNLIFNFYVVPEGEKLSSKVSFSQQFFKE
ncbi:MAG: DUF4426 domain-containing protein [Gammaproteobacteria bacterium]|nr:DUF4426 domain-containing protein [Gammaproteobacteria bacterium]